MRYVFLRDPQNDSSNLFTPKYAGEVPKSQIDTWKAQYKQGIYALVSEDGHIGYFKNPQFNEVNASLAQQTDDDTLIVYTSCARMTYIGGSEEMLNDERKLLGVAQEIKEKMKGVRMTLLNL